MKEITGMSEIRELTKLNGSTEKNGEKNRTLGTERCVNIDNLYIIKKIKYFGRELRKETYCTR